MSDEPSKSIYAKIATVLASTAGISFGLCTVSVFTEGHSKVMEHVPMIFGALVILSLAGLILLGIVFLISNIIHTFRAKDDNTT